MRSKAQDAALAVTSAIYPGLRLLLKSEHPADTLGIILDVTGVPLQFEILLKILAKGDKLILI